LKRNVLLPKFDIPKEFSSEDEYLKHLAYEVPREDTLKVTQEIKERLELRIGND